MGPILEADRVPAAIGTPAGLFHRPSSDRAKAGVANQLVGASQHRDGVELQGGYDPQEGRGIVGSGGGAKQALCSQRQPARLVSGEC